MIAKRTSKILSTWLRRELDELGLSLREAARRLALPPNALSRWANGIVTPGMDNLIKLAVFLNEEPEKVFRLAGKDEFVEVLRSCLPDARRRPVTTHDLYRNPRHAELHERVQRIIRRGHGTDLDDWLSEQDRLDLMSIRLEEIVRLTKSKRGVLFVELRDAEGNSLFGAPWGVAPANQIVNPYEIEGRKMDLSWVKEPPKKWRSYQHCDKQEGGSMTAYLLLENPTLEPYLEKLIETYLKEWAAAGWEGPEAIELL